MARFLSEEWIEALDAALRDDREALRATAGARIAVAQVVTDGPGGRVAYTVQVDDGSARVRGGDAGADVTFTQDHATATAIARGELAAQAAFIEGRLRVGGDLALLMEHTQVLAGLDTALARARAVTTF
jgi:putative sterol carrier protein